MKAKALDHDISNYDAVFYKLVSILLISDIRGVLLTDGFTLVY